MAARFDTHLCTTEMTGALTHARTSGMKAAAITVNAGNDHALAGGYAG